MKKTIHNILLEELIRGVLLEQPPINIPKIDVSDEGVPKTIPSQTVKILNNPKTYRDAQAALTTWEQNNPTMSKDDYDQPTTVRAFSYKIRWKTAQNTRIPSDDAILKQIGSNLDVYGRLKFNTDSNFVFFISNDTRTQSWIQYWNIWVFNQPWTTHHQLDTIINAVPADKKYQLNTGAYLIRWSAVLENPTLKSLFSSAEINAFTKIGNVSDIQTIDASTTNNTVVDDKSSDKSKEKKDVTDPKDNLQQTLDNDFVPEINTIYNILDDKNIQLWTIDTISGYRNKVEGNNSGIRANSKIPKDSEVLVVATAMDNAMIQIANPKDQTKIYGWIPVEDLQEHPNNKK